MTFRKILFINPNRYAHPPVIPLALEYLVHALRRHEFEVRILDLCFSTDPQHDLTESVRDFNPDAFCLSIRNVDSVLFPDTEFFLPEIRDHIRLIRKLSAAPVIIGGAALSANPHGIADFLGADIAVTGPGEEILPRILSEGFKAGKPAGVVKGTICRHFRAGRADLDYEPYVDKEGIPGFETHKGCSSRCAYCMEAGTAVRFREPGDVISELRVLKERGYSHLHLCDTEFNEDPEYCNTLLKRLAVEKLGIEWALYMKPGNYTPRMFDLLGRSGAYLVTLTVHTLGEKDRYWSDVATMIALGKEAGLRMSVDLLTGFPNEDDDKLAKCLDFFRKNRPDDVVVNVFLRLYKNLPISEMIMHYPALHRFLTGPGLDDASLLKPVFYNHVSVDKLKELIKDDAIFRIAGAEKVVNYQKA